jgi:hypothetical protein
MDVYKDDVIDDLSTPTIDIGTGARIFNTKIIDVQTAPMPFITQSSGNLPATLTIPSYGVNGNDAITYDWSIVRIEHNAVTFNAQQKHLGLVVNQFDASSNPIEFSIQNNSALNISWYLLLNGFIDLEGESQLVQGGESILDQNSSGYIERDQQGTASSYNYNYWASSVSPIASGAGTNNAQYTISTVLFDGSNENNPIPINFQAAHTAADGALTSPITISAYWLWKFNGTDNDYDSWISINQHSNLSQGEGYTMKGVSGSAPISNLQNYVFKGKPNNGEITLNISQNENRLIGNPYASAIDANAFILDNISESGGFATANVFNGALYFWDHFAGQTHVLSEYVGGYATYTLMGGAKAYANDTRVNNNGASGTKIPERYIPVNQGFFVVAMLDTVSNSINTSVTGGTITFKNSQRVFATEGSGNSIFLKSQSAKNESSQELLAEDTRPKIRLLFKSPTGYERQLLAGADENASNQFDLGFDGLLIEDNTADMFWLIDNAKFVIQAVNEFNVNQQLNIGLVVEQHGMVTIKAEEMEYIEPGIQLYIHDNVTGLNYNIAEEDAEIYLEKGTYLDRFDVRFKPQQSLSVEDEFELNKMEIFVNNIANELQINNTKNIQINAINLYNSIGQLQMKWQTNLQNTLLVLPISTITTGIYLVQIKTSFGIITKKIIIE